MAKKTTKGNGQPIEKVVINLDFSPEQGEDLLKTLQVRFEKNMNRHNGLEWLKIKSKLVAQPEKLFSLNAMEITGGEPDVVGFDQITGEFIFYDCSPESPIGRRKVCYDREAADKREAPGGNVIDFATSMGIELLTEEQYRELQKLGNFDTKTESWLKTPADIRKLGGAIFGDRRYNHVFKFHSSAPTWYSTRGFRGSLRV